MAAVAMHCGAGVERHQRVPACNAAVRWALGMTTHRLALSAWLFHWLHPVLDRLNGRRSIVSRCFGRTGSPADMAEMPPIDDGFGF
ncbi:hypothetical protein ABFU71_09060 [Xanthomonas campestris pv. raphani]|uniref:hypothetical protein n=1 Tax=Xanthomonas campestris TaxID=339 RepID=UPI003890413C